VNIHGTNVRQYLTPANLERKIMQHKAIIKLYRDGAIRSFWVFGLSPKERTRLAIMILRDKLDKVFKEI
jgi:hypothetical protein